MHTIKDILTKYYSKIDPLDLELIIAHILGKNQEFVLAHPEFKILITHNRQLATLVKRRMKHEPLAYIFGEKEFYGLKFKVNKDVLIPRPETELLVELTLNELTTDNLPRRQAGQQLTTIIDLGTGSGNIIIAIAKQLRNYESGIMNYDFYGIDVNDKALKMAKLNARAHEINHKIKFLKGNLLNPIIHNSKFILHNSRLVILANLPYLSSAIYRSSQKSVQMYEPKKALLAGKYGLLYYERLFKQINRMLSVVSCQLSVILEFSPEQRTALQKLIKKYFPKAKIKFHRDLARKWRVCQIEILK